MGLASKSHIYALHVDALPVVVRPHT